MKLFSGRARNLSIRCDICKVTYVVDGNWSDRSSNSKQKSTYFVYISIEQATKLN